MNMTVVIVRTCDTSKGRIVCEVPGGTKDSDPIELGELEAQNLIAAGNARLVPPAPAIDPSAPEPAPEPAAQAAPNPAPAPAAQAAPNPAPAPAAAAEPAHEEI